MKFLILSIKKMGQLFATFILSAVLKHKTKKNFIETFLVYPLKSYIILMEIKYRIFSERMFLLRY